MDALATVDDVAVRLRGGLADADVPYVQQLLNDASTTVRSFTRQDFTVATTTVRKRPIGDKLILPQRPVTAVNSVAVVDMIPGADPVFLPPGAWMWDGGEEIWLYTNSNLILNLPEAVTEVFRFRTPLCDVNYQHGYIQTPDLIVSIVCSMVIRALSTPEGASSISSQTVGPYSYRTSVTAQDGILALSPSEQQRLVSAGFRRTTRTVELR